LEPVFAQALEGEHGGPVASAAAECLETGVAMALVLPFAPRDAEQRWFVWTGHRLSVDGGHRVALHVVDITGPWQQTLSEQTSAHLDTALASRQKIDLAKGALMLGYGVDAATAFDLLVWWSQRSNTKVQILAERLNAAVAAAGASGPWGRHELECVLVGRSAAPDPDGTRRGRLPLLVRRSRRSDGALLVTVEGDVDLADGMAFAAELRAALDSLTASSTLVLDLAGVGYLGPVGEAVLASKQRRAEAANVALHIVGAPAERGLRAATLG
jgi:anti-anti-sigma factor